MEKWKEKYGYLLEPALFFLLGFTIGILFAPIKKGIKVTVLSGNTIGSKNGSRNHAHDMMVGARKSNSGEKAK